MLRPFDVRATTRVERIPQSTAKQVEGENCQDQQGTGEMH